VTFNQIKALRSIDHPNVIKLKETHEFKDNIILVTEFIGGSSLLRHILSRDHLPESEAAYILQVLLNTVKFFHEKKIIHRNLKPENILLNPTQNGTEIKITDFGFSCTLDDNDQSTWHASRNICNKCGTPGYVAPEILSKRLNTTASDIFSLGIILYTWYRNNVLLFYNGLA
jgi:serine/threonine protein kinase